MKKTKKEEFCRTLTDIGKTAFVLILIITLFVCIHKILDKPQTFVIEQTIVIRFSNNQDLEWDWVEPTEESYNLSTQVDINSYVYNLTIHNNKYKNHKKSHHIIHHILPYYCTTEEYEKLIGDGFCGYVVSKDEVVQINGHYISKYWLKRIY